MLFYSSVYVCCSCFDFYQMHHLHRRDRRRDLVHHRDDHLLQVHRHQLFYMDLNYLHQ